MAETLTLGASIWEPIKGIIVQKGRHVTEFQLNDRVYTTISTKTGTYARYVVASGGFSARVLFVDNCHQHQYSWKPKTATNGTVHHLPYNVSFVEGACYG